MNGLVFMISGILLLSCGNSRKTILPDPEPVKNSQEEVQPLERPPGNSNTDSVKVSMEEPEEKDNGPAETEQLTENAQMSSDTIISEPLIYKEDNKVKITFLTDHTAWNTLLEKYVDDSGNVDYRSFKMDIARLDSYLDYLAKNVPERSSLKNDRLAYYINLYNAATVKLILDNYPLNSIKDIKSPWAKDWVQVGDEKLSLGHIEHKILRRMNEPRIHFAINCASYSCPKLLNEAFTTTEMEGQLQKATKEFIEDGSRNKINQEQLQLSNIFKWYKRDFTKKGSLITYIGSFVEIEIKENATIDYLKYDWDLNEAK